jgi:hypothetical protein
MTAVMRAVAVEDGPRRLRLAVVEAGRVVDERLIPLGAPVTVGTSERATILVATRALPPLHRLFEHDHGSYQLHTLAGMSGRVSIGGELSDISAGSISLDNDARGKLRIGATVLLFQMVVAPAAPQRPQLPLSVKRQFASEVDWFTTVVAAFSFLLHFFAVALIYSDWLDPVIDDDYAMAKLVETTRALPPPPALEQPRTPDAAVKPDATPESKAAAKPGKPGGSQQHKPGKPGGEPKVQDANARAHAIAEQLAAMDVDVLIALNSGGVAVRNVLDDGHVPVDLIDEAARSSIGTRNSNGGLDIGRDRTGSVRVGDGARQRISEIGNDRAQGGGNDTVNAGEQQEAEGPQGGASIGGVGNTGGNIAGAAGTVARMRGRFRHCYQRGLDKVNPEMQGSVTLVAKIGGNGEVTGVSGGGGGLAPIVPCLQSVVRSAQFSPPEGGGGLVSISIIFRKQ